MTDAKYQIGLLIRHPARPDWGLGKILTLDASVARVHFKNDVEDFRAFSLEKVAFDVAEVQSDPVLDNLPPFLVDRFDVTNKRVTLDAGIARFTELFPLGFADGHYLQQERNYKWEAHQRFEQQLGDGRGERLLEEGAITELTNRALAIASHHMNLLSPFESMAFRDGLRADERAARGYFDALFALLREGPAKEPFAKLVRAVSDLPADEGKARVATWPILTLLPYLAHPDRFMFLKPEPTQSCAERLRFYLQYNAALNWITYSLLLDLSDDLLKRLKHLGPRDYIDVQSFMWVIAKY